MGTLPRWHARAQRAQVGVLGSPRRWGRVSGVIICDIIRRTSFAEWPSTYYSRAQRRWLRDLGGTLARAASDVNLADDISDRATPAFAAEKRRAINDLAVQALRVRGERGLI